MINDPQTAEDCATSIVLCIEELIDLLRSEFPTTVSPQPGKSPPKPLYTRAVERGILHKVQEAVNRQKQELGGDTEAVVPSNPSDSERSSFVHELLWPLLHALARCYEVLDALPQNAPPTPSTAKENRRSRNKPSPPRGILSIRNYTDIACLLEFTICVSILPNLENHVLIGIEDRVRYQLPKSLAGRLPKPSLWWGFHTGFRSAGGITQPFDELYETASAVSNVVLLDRFRPMLLPRHIADIYAALFQAEQKQRNDAFLVRAKQSMLYRVLALSRGDAAGGENPVDATLQAKAYQTLLLQGTKAPLWIRQRVSPLLTQLACRDLAAIVQVFVPLQEPSMASLRLGRTLATSATDNVTTTALGLQIRNLLGILFPALLKGEIPAGAMAILQTIWAVVNQWPAVNVEKELIVVWERGMSGQMGGQGIHRTVRQLGALCAFVPPNTNPANVLRGVFVSKASLPSIFDQLLRLGSMTSIVTSKAKTEACQTLQWVSLALSKSKEPVQLGASSFAGPAVLVSTWVNGIAPSSWDVSGSVFKRLNAANEANGNSLEDIGIHEVPSENVHAAEILEQSTNRGMVLADLLLQAPSGTEQDGGSDSHSSLLTQEFTSLLFRLLLRVYLSSTTQGPEKEERSKIDLRRYHLVAIALLPVLCERCSPEGLLFGDGNGALGLLKLVKMILSSAIAFLGKSLGISEEDVNLQTEPMTSQQLADEPLFQCLEMFCTPSTVEISGLAAFQDTSQDDTLLSIASIVLSLLIAVLELGSKLRSADEEASIKSFLPLLQHLASIPTTSSSPLQREQTDAGLADMAGYAMALIASRDAQTPPTSTNERAQLSAEDKVQQMIREAEDDLRSTQPPIRARGIVTLGRLARGYSGSLAKESLPKVVELETSGSSGSNHMEYLVEEVLRLSMTSLGDTESYVYLAGVQAIVAMGDLRPETVLPRVAHAMVVGSLKTGTGEESSTTTLSLEQRIKLAEALMFTIRRRATLEGFVQPLVNYMLFGSAHRIGHSSETDSGVISSQQIQEETHKYFLGLDKLEDSGPESLQEKRAEQDIRVKTGGPVFDLEEEDVLRAGRVSVLAELAACCRPSSLASECRLLVGLSIDILRLETSRSVCRAAALLVRELYGCLLREEDELAEAVDRPKSAGRPPLPLAVALISCDEEVLVATLQSHASGRGDASERGVDDPATTVRCQEALTLRSEAEEAGIFTAATLVSSQTEEVPLPVLLTSAARDKGGIVEIRPLDSLG